MYSVFNTAAAKFEVDLPSRIESLQDVPVKLVEDNADPDLVNFQWWAHPLLCFIFNYNAVFQKENTMFFSIFDIPNRTKFRQGRFFGTSSKFWRVFFGRKPDSWHFSRPKLVGVFFQAESFHRKLKFLENIIFIRSQW